MESSKPELLRGCLKKNFFFTLLSSLEWINFSSAAPVTQQGGGIVSKIKSVLGNRGNLYHCTSECNVSEIATQLQEFRFYTENSGEALKNFEQRSNVIIYRN